MENNLSITKYNGTDFNEFLSNIFLKNVSDIQIVKVNASFTEIVLNGMNYLRMSTVYAIKSRSYYILYIVFIL